MVRKTTRGSGRRPGRPAGGQLLADREQLLHAAERAIRLEGSAVTMEAIAAEAEVTKPILYRGVGDKDDLMQALAERLVDRINSSVTDALIDVRDGREQVRAFVAAYLAVVDGERDLYLFVTAGGSKALHLADRSALPLADGIAAQRAAIGADPSVSPAWSYGLIGMLHFVTLWWMRERTMTLDEVSEAVTELLWSGLRVDQPNPRRRSKKIWPRS